MFLFIFYGDLCIIDVDVHIDDTWKLAESFYAPTFDWLKGDSLTSDD